MILAVGHTKGGVGKSTISVQIATYLKAQKHVKDLWVIDTDPQKSAAKSFVERNSNTSDKILPISCASYSNGKELFQQLKTNKDYYDEIVIDIGARESDSFRSALMLADVLLIPVIPRGYDLEALEDLYPLLEGAWGLGAEFMAYAFLSCADSQGTANAEANEYLQQFTNIKLLNASVNRRKAIGLASNNGLSVFETTPKDSKACAEIEALVSEIYGA